MYLAIATDTLFYRVTDLTRNTWPDDVVSGDGAYFGSGGRYSRLHQPTVYTSDEPLVAISEMAFYQAQKKQTWVGNDPALSIGSLLSPDGGTPAYPLLSKYWLWCFSLAMDPPPEVVDLCDPTAWGTFPIPRIVMMNSSHDYANARLAADAVRGHHPSQHPRLLGLRALSSRTRPLAVGHPPYQHALFVIPPFRVLSQLGNPVLVLPATLLQRWELHIQFHQDTQGNAVTVHSPNIDWRRPRFRLEHAFLELPNSPLTSHLGGVVRNFIVNRWYRFDLQFP